MQIPLLDDFELDITDSFEKNPELYLYELGEEIAFLANLTKQKSDQASPDCRAATKTGGYRQ